MNIRLFFEKVVDSGVLKKSLIELPNSGVTDEQLAEAQEDFGFSVNLELESLLKSFDGANLDVVRFNKLADIKKTKYGIFIASDPAGFVYHLADGGEIVSEDTDGGDVTLVASSLNDFIFTYLFGSRSADFCGEEWHQELVAAGITT